MLAEVPHLGRAPGRILELHGEQAADIGVEEGEAQVEQHQREQEVGHGEADEAHERGGVVADGILPDRGIDADGQGQHPGEEQGGDRDHHRQPQAVSDHLGHGPLPLHGHAEVALGDQLDPLVILDVDGLTQAVLDPQILRLLLGDDAAGGGHLGDVRGDIVPWG